MTDVGMLFGLTMLMVSIALVMAVIDTNDTTGGSTDSTPRRILKLTHQVAAPGRWWRLIVMAVVVTNVYLRKDSTQPVPRFVRRLFVDPSGSSSSPYSYRPCAVDSAARPRRTDPGPSSGKPSVHGAARTLPEVDPSTQGPRRKGPAGWFDFRIFPR